MTKRTGQTIEEMAKGCHYWFALEDWNWHKDDCKKCGLSGVPGCPHGQKLWNNLVTASKEWNEESEALCKELNSKPKPKEKTVTNVGIERLAGRMYTVFQNTRERRDAECEAFTEEEKAECCTECTPRWHEMDAWDQEPWIAAAREACTIHCPDCSADLEFEPPVMVKHTHNI